LKYWRKEQCNIAHSLYHYVNISFSLLSLSSPFLNHPCTQSIYLFYLPCFFFMSASIYFLYSPSFPLLSLSQLSASSHFVFLSLLTVFSPNCLFISVFCVCPLSNLSLTFCLSFPSVFLTIYCSLSFANFSSVVSFFLLIFSLYMSPPLISISVFLFVLIYFQFFI